MYASILAACITPSMAAGGAVAADPNDERSTGDKIGALAIVVAFGALGGIIIQMI